MPADWLLGGGAMGERIRSTDWSRTPLGPRDAWPQSLRSAVGMVLDSRYPMFLWWGPELANLYNDAYIPILGARHPEALGRPARAIWHEIWDVLGPQAEFVLREGRATWNESTLLLMERYGYVEETYFTFSYSPVRDETGRVAGVFCACTEDTARVLGERRLRTLRDLGQQSMAKAEGADEVCRVAAEVLAENAHDLPFALVYLLDGGGREARLRGTAVLPPGSVASPPRVEVGAPGDVWDFASVIERQAAVVVDDLAARFGPLPAGPWDDAATQRAIVLPLSSGAARDLPAGFLVTGLSPRLPFATDYRSFLELAAAQLDMALANARAHEEERRRAEALAELDRAKTTFFSNVSHEFRTPLALMLGPLEEVLSAPDGLPEAARSALVLAQRNALRLLKLVNSLLDFSRIEAGRVEAFWEPTDLATLTADLASHFRSACERASLALHVDCPPLAAPVHVDRDMWEKIVLNLLSNAFKFTWEGGIEVSVRATGEGACLRVRDTGVGIPAHELPRLFERFHRVEGTRGRSQEGTGIGLALVQELVRLHGGRIEVASEPGRGTTFEVWIPAGVAHLPEARRGAPGSGVRTTAGPAAYVEEALRWLHDDVSVDAGGEGERAAAAEGRPGEPRPLGTGEAAARILVADDNADMREYLRRLLAPRYPVEVVADGEAALARARAAPPDLVLTDVMMPGLDGFGLLRALRADPHTRSVPVVLVSARAGEEARVEGLDAGADDYLVKPFGARELLARVDAQVRMGRIRRAEASLRESEKQLRLALRAANAGVFGLDIASGHTVWSDEFRSLYGFDEATPHAWEAWIGRIHPEDRSRVEAEFQALLASSATEYQQEIRIVHPQHGVRWLLVMGRVERGEQGTALRSDSIHIDITERRRAEEALREADRRKDEFLATLAHELRNPLAPIRCGIELLRMEDHDPALVEQSLAIMERQSEQLTRLLDDLLDVSRITRGRLPLRRARVALTDIVGSAVETARPAIDAAGHALRVALPEAPVWLDADPTRLAQVFANLLGNAARYTPPGGHLEIAATVEGDDAVVVAVRDDGFGIEAGMLERIFEMFQQSERSAARRAGGLGIGLTLVRSLVELHGGTVRAASAGPDRGSEFVVRLPLAAPVGSGGAAAADPGDAPAAASGRRVLVVDDNRDAATMLALSLRRLGHAVQTAGGGREALERAAAWRPEVVLLDLGMPDLDGYETARRMREAPWGRGLVLVALSGWGQPADRARTRAAGFDHHLVKPADPAALATLLRSPEEEPGSGDGRAD